MGECKIYKESLTLLKQTINISKEDMEDYHWCQSHPWVVPLGTTARIGKKRKRPNHFQEPFTLNVFTTIIIFSHVYQLYALIYGLKFILKYFFWKLF